MCMKKFEIQIKEVQFEALINTDTRNVVEIADVQIPK